MSNIQIFKTTRERTSQICAPLKVEDFVPQPVDFVSPPKWHLGHTSWFFEEFILKNHSAGYKPYHKDFSYMFNSYYNTIGARLLRVDRGNMTRPSLDEVLAYRKYVDQAMLDLIDVGLSQEAAELFHIGVNHEQQHQELLITDIKYILGSNPLFPAYDSKGLIGSGVGSTMKWVEIDEGMYEVGFGGKGFSYDNEHGRHKIFIGDYSISNALVSNGEYLEFIKDKGYHRHELWLDEGWSWVNEHKIESPLYWHLIDGKWMNYTLSGLKELSLDSALAHVSHYEAAAFAEWRGMRLPTEFEWEVASEHIEWGARWEHTNSAYLAYPGFKRPSGAVGEYNGKFMMNQMVLRGSSVATSEGHSRKSYRNFFHPNMQWQFSGIRLVKNE